jgi:hypothetical protein
MTELTLDFYAVSDGGTRFCWKFGEWSSEEYESEFLARLALRNGKLVFSQVDRYDGYEAALVGAEVNFNVKQPFDYWVIAETWVFEADLGGKQLGEIGQFKFPENAKVLHITQEQFNMMVNDFEDEHGYYPDT